MPPLFFSFPSPRPFAPFPLLLVLSFSFFSFSFFFLLPPPFFGPFRFRFVPVSHSGNNISAPNARRFAPAKRIAVRQRGSRKLCLRSRVTPALASSDDRIHCLNFPERVTVDATILRSPASLAISLGGEPYRSRSTVISDITASSTAKPHILANIRRTHSGYRRAHCPRNKAPWWLLYWSSLASLLAILSHKTSYPSPALHIGRAGAERGAGEWDRVVYHAVRRGCTTTEAACKSSLP